MKIEREFAGRVELRDNEGGGLPDIVGLAAPFYNAENRGTEYELWAGAVERIMPTAFDQSLSDEDDIYASFNHNADNVLGRIGATTLRLSKSTAGLEYAIRANEDSPFYRDLISRIARGDIGGSSITFSVRADGAAWIKSDEDDVPDVRELRNIQLYELGPVVSPAYTATATGLRGRQQLEEARASYVEWQATLSPVKRQRARHWLDPVLLD